MKQSIRPFENIFSVASLLLFSQGFYSIILGNAIGGDEGDVDSVLLRFSFLLIYLITFALLGFRLPRTLAFLKTNFWILCLVGLAIFSVSWSSIPDISFRKVIALIGCTSFALYLGSRYSFEEQLKLYGWTFGIALFLSYIFALVLPAYGIMESGAWRGIYPHKNGLGESMFVSFLTFYFLANSNQKPRLLFKICCLLSVIIIVLGKSATALISVMMIFSLAQGLKLISFKSKKSVFLLLVFLMLSILLIFTLMINLDALLALYDRDITLTGRTPLWADLWEFIERQPWLGYGYGSFFSNLHRETDIIWQIHNWVPPNAHNGFIHIWLNVGLIGLVIFCCGYFKCIFNALFKYLIVKDTHLLWVFLLLFYTIFFNLTEVSFMNSGMLWILSLASIYSLKTTPKKVKSLN